MSDAQEESGLAYTPNFVFEEVDIQDSDNEESTQKDVKIEEDQEEKDEQDDEEEFAFNLFSSAPADSEGKDKTEKDSQKKKTSVVVLTKEDENPVDDLLKASAEAGLKSIDPHGYLVNTPAANLMRPNSYYFSSNLAKKLDEAENTSIPTTEDQEEVKESFQISAVSFEDVMKFGRLTQECKSIRTDYGGGKMRKDKVIDYTELAEKARLARIREKKTKRLGKKSRDRAKKRVEAHKLQRKEERERKKMRRQLGHNGFNKGGFKKANVGNK